MLEALQMLSAREKELTALLQAHLESYDVTQALENQLPWQERALQIHAELQAVYQEELSLFSLMSDEIQQQFIISHYSEMTESEHHDVLLLWMNWKSKLNISTKNAEDLPLFYFLSLKLLLIPTGRKLLKALFDELLKPANQLILQVGKSWGVPRASEIGAATLNYPTNCLQKKISIFPRLIVSDETTAPLTFNLPWTSFAHELIHLLHQLDGSDARSDVFQYPVSSPHYFLYERSGIFADREEMNTIEQGIFSENQLRSEWNLSKRAGQVSSDINDANQLAWLITMANARSNVERTKDKEPIVYKASHLPNWSSMFRLRTDAASSWLTTQKTITQSKSVVSPHN